MPKNIVIVESPAKAKTIEKFLGKDFVVRSSFGHIRDLPAKQLSIDIENGFEPIYEIPSDKKKVISELKSAIKGAEVWLASDEDREGEAIAWHLCQALGLNPTETKRIVFHEITKSAIEQAVSNPRTVNQQLVDAQQARRILDRLVGYELSPVLWKKIRPGLSAGRVQSVAVRLIVEREREIKAFEPTSTFRTMAVFTAGNEELPAELNKRFETEKSAKDFLTAVKGDKWRVVSVEQKPGVKNPGPPFTTSSLQQEAARRLGFSVKQTMTLAQRLYESGHITYMRTDSTVLSGQAIKASEDYIKKTYSSSYHQSRQFKTKNSSAQEAHEAIRPTNFSKQEVGSDEQQKKLYNLIWRRTLASQMSPAQIDKTEVRLAHEKRSEQFVAKGEVLKFDGYLKVYGGGKDDVILPQLQINDLLLPISITSSEQFDRPSPRYSEASLVKKLEELGIGRPSTYAPTISTVQARGYVERSDVTGEERSIKVFAVEGDQLSEKTEKIVYGNDKNKLLPTTLADVTTDFIVKNFAEIVDYDFTAKAEGNFDEIAEGKVAWRQMLKDFYAMFHPLVEESANVSREESTQTRELGKDPASGRPIKARYGRYGPMLQRGETESDDKPDFAPMPDGETIDTVSLEQALEMFKLPRLVGQTDDGQDIKANIGRFGPYIQVGKLFVSIKPHDPMKITPEEALELYHKKLQQEKDKYIQEFPGGIKVVNGPYGPYITDGKKNVRIASSVDPKKLTEAEAKVMIEKAPTKKKKRSFRRKTKS